MRYIIYIVIFIIVFLATFLVYGNIAQKNEIMKKKLSDIRSVSEDASKNEFRAPFSERIIQPAYKKIHSVITKIAPVQIKEYYENLIKSAGNPKKVTVSSIILSQIIFAFTLSVLFYMLMFLTGNVQFGLIMLIFLVGFVFPVLMLRSKSSKRKDKIRSELPDFLDLLYLSVEAGLGFDQAMKSTSDKMSGVFGDEVRKTMNEIIRGREREEAFRGLEKRTGVDEVGSFVVSVIQTERLGSNITNMLRAQSEMMRMKRKQRAEEIAAKMSIKILFPLIICFLPSMFVVILGPGVINIVETLFSIY